MTWPGPRRSVEDLVKRLGPDRFLGACLDLLAGRDVEGDVVHALGGPPARWALDGGESGPSYWLRVWALRGLLWHWDPRATSAVVTALSDESWRVREMAAKVVARHLVGAALQAVAALREDPVPRVRSAADRALMRLVDARV